MVLIAVQGIPAGAFRGGNRCVAREKPVPPDGVDWSNPTNPDPPAWLRAWHVSGAVTATVVGRQAGGLSAGGGWYPGRFGR